MKHFDQRWLFSWLKFILLFMSSFNFKVIWIIGISFLFNSVIALLSFACYLSLFWCNGLDSVHDRCQPTIGCYLEIEVCLSLMAPSVALITHSQASSFSRRSWSSSGIALVLALSVLERYWYFFLGRLVGNWGHQHLDDFYQFIVVNWN